jgi:hypothetical protein
LPERLTFFPPRWFFVKTEITSPLLR